MSDYDVVVLGGGPAGERAAITAAKLGKHVALVERENVVGGTGVNWGAIPSKTLRESALFVQSLASRKQEGIPCGIAGDLTISDFMYRERNVVARELDLINRALDKHAVEVLSGHARFVGPNRVAITGATGQTRALVRGDVIVIATGSSPHHPPDLDFDGQTIFDSATILELPRMPRSTIVLGAGVIGIEYASIFAALGLDVTLVDTRSELLPYLDREVATRLERELRALGIVIVHDDHYLSVAEVPGSPPTVRVATRQGNVFEADILLYCVGRTGNSLDLDLNAVGITPAARGLIDVNEHFQTSVPHIYAVGDVIGYPALASTSMEQGRQAIRHAFGVPGPQRKTELLPFAIYAIPEVSYIGESEEKLRAQGVDFVTGRGRYDYNARGQIVGDLGGLLKLLFDRKTLRLLGVHIVGRQASELIHIGQAFLYHGATAHEVAEVLYNYPTLSDLYRHAATDAIAAASQRSSCVTSPPVQV